MIGVMLHCTSDDAFGAPNPARPDHSGRRQDGATLPADAPTAPTGTPVEGGVLVAGTTREPDTLHPWLTQLVTTDDVFTGVIEGFFSYDSTQMLVPQLATGFEVSDDGLTYTFALRPGVTWHTGDPFTPQDVVDSWNMRLNPDFGAFSIEGWSSIGDIAVDGERVVITLSEFLASFISYVGVGYLCPSAAIAAGPQAFKEAFSREPYGTGPFRFVAWKPGEQIELERYDGYWGEPARLERIVYRFLPDDSTQLVQLRTGEIQLGGGSGGISANRVDEALEIDGIQLVEYSSQSWQHFDLKNIGFLRETKVRQALDFATPTQQIIDQLLQGRAFPSIGDQAPGTWAHNPNVQPRPYDVEQAKALLDEVGLAPNGDGVRERDGVAFEVEIWGLAGDALDEQICQVVAQSWNSIGVKSEVFLQDISTIWGPEGYQFTDKMTACLYTWTNTNDPDDKYYWHSESIPTSPTGTGGNLVAYFFPFTFQLEIDDLTERARLTADQDERKALYWQIQELLHEEVPNIFLYWPKEFAAVTTILGGFWPSAYNSLMWNAGSWYLTE
jgi:peptide/nickel transport system substrate-binding protein